MMNACGYARVRVHGMVNARKYGTPSASAIWIPAMAEGDSMIRSLPWQAFQAVTSSSSSQSRILALASRKKLSVNVPFWMHSCISSAGSLFDLAPSEPEPAKAEPAEQVDAPATTEAADWEASEPEAQAEAATESHNPEEGPEATAPETTSAAEPDEEAGTETPGGQANAASNGSAPAQSSGETHEPKRPEGGIDETKSLFDL